MTLILTLTSIFISFIILIRLLLLDKEYCRLVIIDKELKFLINYDLLKNGYNTTHIVFVIQVLKSDIYDLKINHVKNITIKTNNKNNLQELKSGDKIEFFYFNNIKTTIILTYSDNKNNIYEQKITIIPFLKNEKCVKQWSVVINNRNWLFFKSLKNKYL